VLSVCYCGRNQIKGKSVNKTRVTYATVSSYTHSSIYINFRQRVLSDLSSTAFIINLSGKRFGVTRLQHWRANNRIENKSHTWVTRSSDLIQHYGVAVTFRTYILFTWYCYIWIFVPPRDVIHLDHFLSCTDMVTLGLFLGAFAKLPKENISFVMSACPFVRMKQLGSHWVDIHEIWYLSVFRKSVEKIQMSLKSDKNNSYFAWGCLFIYNMSLNSP
jgi:hypothetical protein